MQAFLVPKPGLLQSTCNPTTFILPPRGRYEEPCRAASFRLLVLWATFAVVANKTLRHELNLMGRPPDGGSGA